MKTRSICGYLLPDGPVLVTGAGGFAGRNLMDLFGLGAGDYAADATCDFQAPEGVRRIAWPLPGPPPVSLGEVRYVVHLAGISSVSRSLKEGDLAMEVNARGTDSVLSWVTESSPNARFLLASSSEVYRPSRDPLSEGSPLEPASPYGRSKLAAERLVEASGLDWVISRSFPHFGPWQQGRFVLPSFCRRIIQAARENRGSITTGNLDAVRDYLYVKDTVDAYACLLARGRAGGLYNVCSGAGRSIGELLEMLVEISGHRVEPMIDPSLLRNRDQFRQVGDPSRLEALGWEVQTPLPDGLRILYEWWEERL